MSESGLCVFSKLCPAGFIVQWPQEKSSHGKNAPDFLVGMVLSGSSVAAWFRSEIARFDTCKSVAIWAIETPSFNIVRAGVFFFI